MNESFIVVVVVVACESQCCTRACVCIHDHMTSNVCYMILGAFSSQTELLCSRRRRLWV